MLHGPPSRFAWHRKLAALAERDPRRVAGVLLLVGAITVLMGIITAQALYNGTYSTTQNTISDLGANPLHGGPLKPSAVVFDLAMIVAALLLIGSAYLLQRAFGATFVALSMALFGVGVLGVGIFPENLSGVHTSFAGLAFLGGAITAILSYRTTGRPFRYVALALGTFALLTMIFWMAAPSAFERLLGAGGVERWVVYPVTIWAASYAGWLLHRE
ncbi:MAG: DUF998 domain-containing protein [Dehalococcoidia bacterium]|nr:DUF998 domain-containing protein [Dehalococcoidia bacterium]